MKTDIKKAAPDCGESEATNMKNNCLHFSMIEKLKQEVIEEREKHDILKYYYAKKLLTNKVLEIRNLEMRKEIKGLKEKIKVLEAKETLYKDTEEELKEIKSDNKDLRYEINALLSKEAV